MLAADFGIGGKRLVIAEYFCFAHRSTAFLIPADQHQG